MDSMLLGDVCELETKAFTTGTAGVHREKPQRKQPGWSHGGRSAAVYL